MNTNVYGIYDKCVMGYITSLIAICSASFALIAMGIDIVKSWRDEK